jgi:hypothetical protein
MALVSALSGIEDTIDGRLNFHLDAENDVLYLKRVEYRQGPTYGEETPEEFTFLRTADGTEAGLTVINYWRDFGKGPVNSATMRVITERIGDWANRYFIPT